jgi:WD40 repeat protein
MLATGDINGIIWISDLDQGEVVLTLSAPPMPVYGLAFSPDGLLAAASVGSARIWDVRSLFDPADAQLGRGQVISQSLVTLDCAGVQLDSIAFSQDGRLLATGGADGTVRVWDVPSSLSTGQGKELVSLEGHSGGIRDLAFNGDGSRLATVCNDGTARLWDISFEGPGEGIVFVNGPPGPPPWVVSLDLSADGRRLAAADSDLTPKIWDAESGELLLTLSGHEDEVQQIVFSPDGRMVVTSSLDDTVRGWDSSSGSELFRLVDQSCNAGISELCLIAFSPDGALLANSEFDGQVCVYETESLVSTPGEQVSARYMTWLNDFNRDICFSHDGKRIAMASSDSTVRVWDLEKGSQALTMRGHTNPVYGVSYSPDGSKIASAGDDETARVWDAESGAFLFTLAGHTEAVFRTAFNPDGTRVATASLDGTAKVWDAATGEELFTLYGHQGFVLDLVFSPDGRRLYTASVDGTIRSYLLDIDELIALAKSRVTRSLTAEECKTYLHREECPPSAAD